LTDSRRRRRPSLRERSKFGRGTTANRDIIRFRRNRELLVREITVLVLWIAVAVMLVNLAQVLVTVSRTHLAERSALLRNALPFVPVLAAIFCIWRARLNFREIREIRAEQAAVKERMTRPDDNEPPRSP
jgi:hypothetical protein